MQQITQLKKVLVANRGEIAVRIFRACYDLGLHTVAIYSNEDTYSLFRTKADEAYLVGEKKSPLGAYLDIPGIIGLAKRRGVTAIHPGYGFLSENADFARACEDNGILFVGPSSDVLAKMGDKLSAKEIAVQCGVPIIPGCTEPLKDADDALEKAVSFGFPIILKAAAGGGGRGMRRCDKPEEVKTAYELVHSEAEKSFGCGDMVSVRTADGAAVSVMAYIMAEPMCRQPALPSPYYYRAIQQGFEANDLPVESLEEAWNRTIDEVWSDKVDRPQKRNKVKPKGQER